MGKVKFWIASALALLVSTTVAGFACEGFLRAFPFLISNSVLLEFNAQLRAKIAAGLRLPLKRDRICMPGETRSDKGPDLCLIAANTLYFQAADDIDRRYGAVEETAHDARGFCNPAFKGERAWADIVFLGDSFTWCTLVSPADTYAALVEAVSGISTYNLGVPGVGLYEYLTLLENEGLSLHPRIVVMTVYEGNDLRDAERYHRVRDKHQSPGAALTKKKAAEETSDASLLHQSYALNYFNAWLKILRRNLSISSIDFGYEVAVRGRPIALNVANSDQDEVRYARRLQRGELSLGLWDDALARFSGLAREHGFTPVVAYVPSAYTAYRDSVVFRDEGVKISVSEFSAAQRHYLATKLKSFGIPFWDAVPYLQRRVKRSDLAYFPADVHLTREGHRLLAEYFLERLAESGYVAGQPRDATRSGKQVTAQRSTSKP